MTVKKIIIMICLLALPVLLIITRPSDNVINLSDDVESAINSIEFAPYAIADNQYSTDSTFKLGNWSKIDMQCAFPKRDNLHPNPDNLYPESNNLKVREVVIKKAFGNP